MLKTRAEQDVKMAGRLYECRDAARLILGSRYAETIAPWKVVIGAHMHAGTLSVLQAVIRIGHTLRGDDATVLMLVMAAAVEMMEHPASAASLAVPKGQD